jgi:hypothetical protein
MLVTQHQYNFSHVGAAVFHNVTPFNMVIGDRLFRETFCVDFLCSSPSSPLQHSETLVQ